MARTTDQPARATRRRTTAATSETRGLGSHDEHDQDDRSGANDQRHEGRTTLQDDQRDNAHDYRDERESSNGRLDSESDENRRDEHRDSGEHTEASTSMPQAAAIPAAYAPVLEAWKQVFTSWSELTETMMKAQQDTFASMINGANAHAKDLKLGERQNGGRAFSGSRTAASTSDRVDHDRR